MTSGIKNTRKEIEDVVKSLCYNLKDEFVEKTNRKVIIEDKDGYKFLTRLDHLIRNHDPDLTNPNNPFSIENIELWIQINEKPFALLPHQFYKNAYFKMSFKCLNIECEEEFSSDWTHIYNHNQGCPFCAGSKVGKRNNLEYKRPDLMKEWDYSKNKTSPDKITTGTNKKFWWICPSGHEYFASVSTRTKGSGCRKCSDKLHESKVSRELKRYFEKNTGAMSEYRLIRNPDTNNYLPYDIYISHGKNPKINGFYIEVHGDQHYRLCNWHRKQARKNKTTPEEEFEYQKYKDKIKKSFAIKNGIYIEIDLRKIKTTEEAIGYIERIIEKTLSK